MARTDKQRASAAGARLKAQEQRELLAATSAVSENDPVRVSPRTVSQLKETVDGLSSANSALHDRTNVLLTQRNTHNQTSYRLQKTSAAELAALESEHQLVLAALHARISQLELELIASTTTTQDLRNQLRAAAKREERLEESRDQYCNRLVTAAVQTATTFLLKKHGRFTDAVRFLVAELVSVGKVPTENVAFVIRSVATCAGLRVLPEDGLSPRSVGRFTGEGGIASELQIAMKIMDPDVTGICLSGDGTSDRNLQFESRHITVTQCDGTAETLCLGIERPVDHTAQTQFLGWTETIARLDKLRTAGLNSIPPPERLVADAEHQFRFTFWRLFMGSQTDHAADQGATVNKLYQAKIETDLEERGLQAVHAMPPAQYQSVLCQERWAMVKECGGELAWLCMSTDERRRHEDAMVAALIQRIGQKAYDALTPTQKAAVRFFVRAGCCMHKELNCVLAGVKAMMASWAAARIPGPIKLFNRDNAAAAASGTSEARARAEEISEGGGVKFAQLFGTLFNHPNDKKGYGDLFRAFMREKFGHSVRIADSMTCRYQSNYDAARFILEYRPMILEFLELIRSGKTTHTWNHLEQNVCDALHDGPTLTELVMLARYGTAIGRPYMRQIRAHSLVDMMTLIPLHKKIIGHCTFLSSNPHVLSTPLSEDAHTVGALDGEMFDDQALFLVVQELAMAGLLPHIDKAHTAFFTGAGGGWEHFTPEFAEDGAIATATDAQRAALVIPATNDVNEGLLGAYRVIKRMKPSMRLRFFNAIAMYKRNKTGGFLIGLDVHLRRFLRHEQRRRDRLGLSRREDAAQMAHEQRKKAAYDVLLRKRAAEKARREHELDDFEPTRFMSFAAYRAAPRVNGTIIEANIRWHRARGTGDVIAKLKKTKPLPKRVPAKRALLAAILSYRDTPEAFGDVDEPFPIILDDPEAPAVQAASQDAMDCTLDN